MLVEIGLVQHGKGGDSDRYCLIMLTGDCPVCQRVWIYFSSLGTYFPWIGFHDANDNDNHVWLNGNPLPDDDENWKAGKYLRLLFLCDPSNKRKHIPQRTSITRWWWKLGACTSVIHLWNVPVWRLNYFHNIVIFKSSLIIYITNYYFLHSPFRCSSSWSAVKASGFISRWWQPLFMGSSSCTRL